MGYIGRFAPTPSGPLHIGSLSTALASYLDARHQGGQWLVRLEDVDQSRCQAGADTAILKTLARFGLHWDAPPLYQSKRVARYTEILDHLARLKTSSDWGGPLFACTCSRQKLAAHTGPYPGFCKHATITRFPPLEPPQCDWATRWQLPDVAIDFEDRLLGSQNDYPAQGFGAPILKRKDGFFAYHWAVVIDDWDQNITDVVRGRDILEQTSIHICLQRALKAPVPRYTHLPLILGTNGKKLSKSERATSLTAHTPSTLLLNLLIMLGQFDQETAKHLQGTTPDDIIKHAIPVWSLDKIPKNAHFCAQILSA